MNHSDINRKCRSCASGIIDEAGVIRCDDHNSERCCDIEKCPGDIRGGPFDFSQALIALKRGYFLSREY